MFIEIVLAFVVWLVSFAVCVFSWSNIIGSFQHFHKGWIITVLVHAAILVALFFIARWLLSGSWLIFVYYVAVVVAFILSLRPQT